jgi:hypothetical protein
MAPVSEILAEVDAVIDAAQAFLTGNQRLQFLVRAGSAGAPEGFRFASESSQRARILRAVRAKTSGSAQATARLPPFEV